MQVYINSNMQHLLLKLGNFIKCLYVKKGNGKKFTLFFLISDIKVNYKQNLKVLRI